MEKFTGLEPGAIIKDNFQIVEKLGEGGFGVVYKARQINTGQIVAVKLLIPDRINDTTEASLATARFEREMHLIAKLNHPNTVRLIDAGRLDDERLFTVLEFVQGMDLSQILAEEESLEPEETKHLMLQVIDALCAAHALGIVHRDLKPANIMISSEGAQRNVKVLDFGISGVLDEARDEDYKDLTGAGSIPGTPSYMAPEQLEEKSLTPQSDIYSWGLVLLECLTGERCVNASSLAGIVFKQVSPKPVPIPLCIAEHPLGSIIKKAIHKNLEERFQDSKEVFNALRKCDVSDLRLPWLEGGERPNLSIPDARSDGDQIGANEHTVANPGGLLRSGRDGAGKNKIIPVMVVVLILLLAIGAWLALSGKDDGAEGHSGAKTEAKIEAKIEAPAQNNTTGSKQNTGPEPRPDAPTTKVTPLPTVAVKVESPKTGPLKVEETAAVAALHPVDPPPLELPKPEMIRVDGQRVSLGLDAKGLEALKKKHSKHVFKIHHDMSILEEQPWTLPTLDVMKTEVTGALLSAHRGKIEGLEDLCPGKIKPGPPEWPAMNVSAKEAAAFCSGLGMRLPTSREWEGIARGPQGLLYPFSVKLTPERVAALQKEPLHKNDWNVTPEGVVGMAGGASEWVTCQAGKLKFCRDGYGLRGGSWNSDPLWFNASMLERPGGKVEPACASLEGVGFRCVREVEE